MCVCRLQEKHVKEKQCEHQKNIIEVQEKLKTNLSEVSVYIPYIRRCCRRLCRLLIHMTKGLCKVKQIPKI